MGETPKIHWMKILQALSFFFILLKLFLKPLDILTEVSNFLDMEPLPVPLWKFFCSVAIGQFLGNDRELSTFHVTNQQSCLGHYHRSYFSNCFWLFGLPTTFSVFPVNQSAIESLTCFLIMFLFLSRNWMWFLWDFRELEKSWPVSRLGPPSSIAPIDHIYQNWSVISAQLSLLPTVIHKKWHLDLDFVKHHCY